MAARPIPENGKEALLAALSQLLTALPKNARLDLPPLRLAILDESSCLVEWTFKDRRLGFSFEADPKDSGWYYVYSKGDSERYESGSLDQLEIKRLIQMTLRP